MTTLPAIVTVLLGMCAAQVLARRRPLGERLVCVLAIGVALMLAGLVCTHWLPINKKLWTPSFTLFMAGLDCVLFAGFAWLVDGLGWRRPVRPFVILGMNAIAIYIISKLLDSGLRILQWRAPIYGTLFAPIFSPINASLSYAVAYTLLMFVIAWVMCTRRVFLKA